MSQLYSKQDVELPTKEQGKEQKVGQLADIAQQELGKIADEARQEAETQLNNQKDRAADTLSGVAATIREAGNDPRELGQTPVAPFTDKIADQVEKVSTYLRRRDITALRIEIERFARAQPPLFAACAVATGWLGARLLKSRRPVDSRQPSAYTPSMLSSAMLMELW